MNFDAFGYAFGNAFSYAFGNAFSYAFGDAKVGVAKDQPTTQE